MHNQVCSTVTGYRISVHTALGDNASALHHTDGIKRADILTTELYGPATTPSWVRTSPGVSELQRANQKETLPEPLRKDRGNAPSDAFIGPT